MTNKDIFRELGGLNAHTVLDAAPDKPVGAPVWLRITAAAACAVLILAGALAAPHLLPDTPSLPVENSGETSGQPTTQPITQPVTPPVTEPQKPVFNTVVRTLSLAGSPDDGSFSLTVYDGTFTFAFESEQPFVSEEHRECVGVCYGMDDDAFFCAACALKEQLADTPGINSVELKYFSPAQNKALFADGKKAYIYDFATKALKTVNVDAKKIFPCVFDEMGEDDGVYALLGGTPGYWLVNLSTAEIVQVAKAGKDGKDYPTSDDMTWFSRGQKFVYYVLADGESSPLKSTTVFLNLQTRERTLIKGWMVDGTPDDRYFTMQTEDGLMVFDTEKNAVVPFEGSGIPELYRYSLKTDQTFYEVGNRTYLQLSVTDLLTGETVYTFDGYVVACARSADLRYVYAYTRDESALRVLDLTTMQEGIAPFEQTFLEKMTDPEYARAEVNFDMSVRASDGAVLLSYSSTAIERQFIEDLEVALEEHRKQEELSPSESIRALMNANKFTSIASLGEVLEKHPGIAEYLVAFRGEGYTYLYYFPLFSTYKDGEFQISNGRPVVAVEDYRTSQFYVVHHQLGVDLNAQFNVDSDTLSVLQASAQTDTLVMLKKYGVPVRTAGIDYGKYIKDGVLLREEMLKYAYSLEHIIGRIQHSTFDKPGLSDEEYPKGPMRPRQSAENIAEAEEFARFADRLTWEEITEYIDPLGPSVYQYGIKISTRGEPLAGMSVYRYNEYTYSIGVWEGKPCVARGNYRAYISQEEYDYWTEWFDTEFYAQFYAQYE